MRSWRIYLILHEQSGRVYIGQTSHDVWHRVTQHFTLQSLKSPERYGRSHLCPAIAKYGRDAFRVFEIYSKLSQAEANELERALIAEHRATDEEWGFNIKLGGDGYTKERCVRGHDVTVPNARNVSGHCRACVTIVAREGWRRRHAKAQAEKERQGLIRPRHLCKRGHDRSVPGAVNAGNACVVCMKTIHAFRKTVRRRHEREVAA